MVYNSLFSRCISSSCPTFPSPFEKNQRETNSKIRARNLQPKREMEKGGWPWGWRGSFRVLRRHVCRFNHH